MSSFRSLRVLPALLYTAAIFYGGVIDVGPLPDPRVIPADKLLHFAAFLGLEWLLELALLDVRQRRPLAVAIAALLGLGLEAVQAALPHRSAELLDLVADATGALAGGLLLSLLARVRPLRLEQ